MSALKGGIGGWHGCGEGMLWQGEMSPKSATNEVSVKKRSSHLFKQSQVPILPNGVFIGLISYQIIAVVQ